MQLTITVKDGATGKDIAAQLRFQAGLLEGMSPRDAASRKNTDGETEAEVSTDEVEETPAPKAAKSVKKTSAKKAAASFEEDETEAAVEDEETSDTFEDTEESFEEPAPKAVKAKAKKLTLDDVNDACKAFARENGGGKDGREAVLKLLKKNFKTASISEIAVDDYPKAIKLLAV